MKSKTAEGEEALVRTGKSKAEQIKRGKNMSKCVKAPNVEESILPLDAPCLYRQSCLHMSPEHVAECRAGNIVRNTRDQCVNGIALS